MAAAMLAVLMALVTSTFSAVERDARSIDRRALAMMTLENALEELLLASWNEINEERISTLALPEHFVERWPKAKLTGEVVVAADSADGKRISLTLMTDPNARERPVTLTTWIYQAQSE